MMQPGQAAADEEEDVYEEEPTTPSQQTASAAATGAARYPPSSSQWAPEFGGQSYTAPGWETMHRHHHPTRLSDVMEEDDERSRTSASQVSRV